MTTALLIDTLEDRVEAVLGIESDPMWALDLRALELLWDEDTIVWECDARTFQPWHVSASAEAVLEWPRARWTGEPGFWARVVVHPDDREAAVAYCAAEARAGRHHEFVYRALTASGRVVRLRHWAKVIPGDDGAPECLRSAMVVIRD
ncbi:MAG TPA: PAS domain-containing protein [Longimicrobium sp.]|nr:PAS domain-containing protein [Longimicrobium sp.]